MKKKSLMILGSTGFFGKSIIDYLGYDKKFNKKINKAILVSRNKKNFITNKLKKKYDILEIKNNLSKIKKIPYADYVIYAVINKNIEDDFKSVKNFVELAKKYLKGSNILFASSGAVYGNQPEKIDNLSEKRKLNPDNHESDVRRRYSKTKYKSEKEFFKLKKFNIKISIARCFAFVGKNLPLNKNFVIGNIIKNILEKKTIIIKSKKRVLRSYMHADDLVYCLFTLLFDEKTKIKIFNIGSEDIFEIRDLVKRLSKKFKIKYRFKQIKDLNLLDKYIPDFTKFRKKYKFKKSLSSYSSIIKTIEYFKTNGTK